MLVAAACLPLHQLLWQLFAVLAAHLAACSTSFLLQWPWLACPISSTASAAPHTASLSPWWLVWPLTQLLHCHGEVTLAYLLPCRLHHLSFFAGCSPSILAVSVAGFANCCFHAAVAACCLPSGSSLLSPCSGGSSLSPSVPPRLFAALAANLVAVTSIVWSVRFSPNHLQLLCLEIRACRHNWSWRELNHLKFFFFNVFRFFSKLGEGCVPDLWI